MGNGGAVCRDVLMKASDERAWPQHAISGSGMAACVSAAALQTGVRLAACGLGGYGPGRRLQSHRHHAIEQALIKDSWTITYDSLRLS
jgi:hypothetical protein